MSWREKIFGPPSMSAEDLRQIMIDRREAEVRYAREAIRDAGVPSTTKVYFLPETDETSRYLHVFPFVDCPTCHVMVRLQALSDHTRWHDAS